jgi:hypothetical protein
MYLLPHDRSFRSSFCSTTLNKQPPPPLLNLKTSAAPEMPPINIKKSMNEAIIVVILKGVMQLILV